VTARVAVVFGGRSSEHAVSCSRGAASCGPWTDRYDVLPVGIAKDGHWVLAPTTRSRASNWLPGTSRRSTGARRACSCRPVDDRSGRPGAHGAAASVLGEVDVVFPVLHGPFGEDGTIQGLLDLADVRYVGSGVFASAAMMDKHYMKVVFAGGAPRRPVCRHHRPRLASATAARRWTPPRRWALPVFVKPARAGSSMGITRVSSPAGLKAAIEAAREHDPKVVVEAAIFGREIECAVLEGRGVQPPRTSVVGE
jgi:D-alanine-D-alanine ligase